MEQDQSLWKTCFHCKSGISTFTTRKKRKTLEQLSFTSCCTSSPPFFCLDPSIQPPRTLLSPSVSSTCPNAPFPPALSFLFLPPHHSFSWFLLYLKIAVHLCNHSFFSHPSHPFLLSVARSAEKNKRKKRVRESPDHNRKQGTGRGEGGEGNSC